MSKVFLRMATCTMIMGLILSLLAAAESVTAEEIEEQEGGLQPWLGAPRFESRPLFDGERFPNVVVTRHGTVLATWGSQRVRLRRSEDGGQTWGEEISIGDGIHGGGVTVDETRGDILVFTHPEHPPRDGETAPRTVYRSTDDGRTWQVAETTFHDDPQGFVPSLHMMEHGTTLLRGKHAGRLIRPARVYRTSPKRYATTIYSDDGGKNWYSGQPFAEMGTGEAALVELHDGRLLGTARKSFFSDGEPLRHERVFALSEDGGDSWRDAFRAQAIPDGPRYRGTDRRGANYNGHFGMFNGLVRLPVEGRDILIYSNADHDGHERVRMTVWASFDGGRTWPVKRLVHEGPSAYSSLTAGRPGTASEGWIYLQFERGEGDQQYVGCQLARFNLSWLLAGEATGDGQVPKWIRDEAERPAADNASMRPNVLWLTAEDLSPHLGCYGDPYACTPNLDALAESGTRYTLAFATAPVCSPARSCLITGMYATTLGTQRLRSHFPIPEDIRGFTAYLREAGYYCSNNVKTDYNMRDEQAFVADAWDESSPAAHWRNRAPGQPFFAVFNFMTTHQSRTSVWPGDEFEQEIGANLEVELRHDPDLANLPPYYPVTAEARRAWARYHDCITLMDQQVGEVLRQLDADGLADDTLVFFYGDHGMGMPRGKRVLHDSGLQVPLIICFGDNWQHLAPTAPGMASDRLVSFVDFAPSVLSLCGVKIPEYMQGLAFLGPKADAPREFVYGARDRVDEVFDLSRSVRDDRWLYIRNFMPHFSWMPPERYSDQSAFRRHFRDLAQAGQLQINQLTYAAPQRALEELYDTDADPHQLHNLAASAAHYKVMHRLRSRLHEWQMETRDAGFLTEPQMWKRLRNVETPLDLARQDELYPLGALLAAADLVGRQEAWPQQIQLLAHEDAGLRYWGAVGLHASERLPSAAMIALEKRLADSSPVVRIEAAAALAAKLDATDKTEASLAVLRESLQSSYPEEVLHAARAVELLGPAAQSLSPIMKAVLNQLQRTKAGDGDMRMFIQFSLEAALERIAE